MLIHGRKSTFIEHTSVQDGVGLAGIAVIYDRRAALTEG